MSSELAHTPLLPPIAIAIYIACVAGAAALANCSVLAALFKSPKHGIRSIIIQLAVADFLIIGTTALPELWFFNARSWNFGYNGCVAYRGLSVFVSTASSYLIACMALHTIATINVEKKSTQRLSKNNVVTDDEDFDASHHSLVPNSDTSTPPQTMQVDYHLLETRIAVTPPTAFVWILSASLSVPEFALATTINLNQNTTLCTAVDSHHRLNMNSLLAAFNLFLPMVLMIVASVLLISKLKAKSFPDLKMCNAKSALKLSLWLIIVYGVLCVPRSVATIYYVYTKSYSDNQIMSFQMEKLDIPRATIRLALSGAYLCAPLLRPILIMIMLPRIRKPLAFGSRSMDKI